MFSSIRCMEEVSDLECATVFLKYRADVNYQRKLGKVDC